MKLIHIDHSYISPIAYDDDGNKAVCLRPCLILTLSSDNIEVETHDGQPIPSKGSCDDEFGKAVKSVSVDGVEMPTLEYDLDAGTVKVWADEVVYDALNESFAQSGASS